MYAVLSKRKFWVSRETHNLDIWSKKSKQKQKKKEKNANKKRIFYYILDKHIIFKYFKYWIQLFCFVLNPSCNSWMV